MVVLVRSAAALAQRSSGSPRWRFHRVIRAVPSSLSRLALALSMLGGSLLLAAGFSSGSAGPPPAVSSAAPRSAGLRDLRANVTNQCSCSLLCSPRASSVINVRVRGRFLESAHKRRFSFGCVGTGPCSANDGDLLAVIVVASAPSNLDQRSAVRSTWGGEALVHSMRMVFLTGLPADATTRLAMNEESERYGDLIVGDFPDTYDLLTVKSVAMLAWVNRTCLHARYLIKVDDDMYVSLRSLKTTLRSYAARGRCIIGERRDRMPVITKGSHKWRDPLFVKHYGIRYYPRYVSGTTYVISMPIVPELLKATQTEPFDRMEDVFVTGICAEKIGNVTHVRHHGFTTAKRRECDFANPGVVTGHHVTPSEMRSIWAALRSGKCRRQLTSAAQDKSVHESLTTRLRSNATSPYTTV